MYLVFLNITICTSTPVCSSSMRKKRPKGGKTPKSSSTTTQRKENKRVTLKGGSRTHAAPTINLAPTQEEDEKSDGKVKATPTPTPTAATAKQNSRGSEPAPPASTPVFAPEKDEGCDDYLNALGEVESADAKADDLAQTQKTETPMLTGKVKKKRKTNSTIFVRNTMENIPTIT